MTANNDFLKVCVEAVRAGGAVVQEWFGRVEATKKGPADLVTPADFASQEAVRRVVLGAFPDHALLGEEEIPGEPVSVDAEYRWIVDPLDGTTNYAHGVPHYAVSLALAHRGEAIVGAVYDPVRDECFTAAAGGGAHLNGRSIRTSGVTEMSEALGAVGFPPAVQADSPDLRMFTEAVVRCQSIRRTGSAALNLCYVAAGRFDLYWSFSTKVWDVAAGTLLVREAGGALTAPDGSPFQLDDAQFLAAATEPLRLQLQQLRTRRDG